MLRLAMKELNGALREPAGRLGYGVKGICAATPAKALIDSANFPHREHPLRSETVYVLVFDHVV